MCISVGLSTRYLLISPYIVLIARDQTDTLTCNSWKFHMDKYLRVGQYQCLVWTHNEPSSYPPHYTVAQYGKYVLSAVDDIHVLGIFHTPGRNRSKN